MRRKWAFVMAAVTGSLALTVAVLLAADTYARFKFQRSAGLNRWGYRGQPVERKQAGEQRVAVLGGSTAFGYGVTAGNAFPAILERKLNAAVNGHVAVVNLAYNSEGAYSFAYTLRDFEYLRPDVVIFYTGYNDLAGRNTYLYRHTSLVFRLTGYMPILPLVAREKVMSILYRGDLDGAYRASSAIFGPGRARPASQSASEASHASTPEAEIQSVAVSADGCGEPWSLYCDWIRAAVDVVLEHRRDAIVVTQPYLSPRHMQQQQTLHAFLQRKYGRNPRLHLVNLGRVLVLSDPMLSSDGMHLTARGNNLIAQHLASTVAQVLRARRLKAANHVR